MKTFLRKCLLLIAMLAPVCGLSAEEVTFAIGTDSPASGKTSISKGGVTLSVSDGDLSRTDNYRVYANQSLTITTNSGNITKIVLNCTGSGENNYSPSKLSTTQKNYTYSGQVGTWEKQENTNTVTFSASAQVRMTSVVVTIETTTEPTDPEKTATTVTFADGDKTFTQGDEEGTASFTNLAIVKDNEGNMISDAAIEYTSSNEEFALVENGAVVVNTTTPGTCTITATYAGNDTYNGSSASYTITVKKAVITGADNYVKIDGTDDLTGKYVIIGTVAKTSTNYILTKITGTNRYYDAAQITLNDNQISAIPESAEGHAVFTFEEVNKTYAFKNTTTGLYTKIGGGTSNNTVSEVVEATGAGTHATIEFDDEKGTQTVKFDADETKNYLQFNPNNTPRFSSYDNQNAIKLFRHGYSRTVTNEWGTLCLPYGGTISGANLYTIEGKDAETATELYLTKAEKVEAGKPYIIKVTAEDMTFTVYYEGDINTTAASESGLIGSYNGQDVEAGMYVINGGLVKKCGANSKIGTNRCYINMNDVAVTTAPANALILSFDDTTDAIKSIETNATGKSAIYDLSGRRVKTAKKGLYIVNGKKVIK